MGQALFKHDEITKRIFGNYISRYDFKRAEEDGATVKLIYDSRGEKLGIANLDLNDEIAEAIDKANLDADQEAKLERLLGKNYEVITADDRLDKVANDFVEYCSRRWQCGKSMFVCIDKITCARMFQRITPRWQAKIAELQKELTDKEVAAKSINNDEIASERHKQELSELRDRIAWMKETIIEIIISESQNELSDFKEWGFDIRPHRDRMKNGFETPDGKRVSVEDAFKDPKHPFRHVVDGIRCRMPADDVYR